MFLSSQDIVGGCAVIKVRVSQCGAQQDSQVALSHILHMKSAGVHYLNFIFEPVACKNAKHIANIKIRKIHCMHDEPEDEISF